MVCKVCENASEWNVNKYVLKNTIEPEVRKRIMWIKTYLLEVKRQLS